MSNATDDVPADAAEASEEATVLHRVLVAASEVAMVAASAASAVGLVLVVAVGVVLLATRRR